MLLCKRRSLLDNFEWTKGFTSRFGITHVDFGSAERTRTLKDSARWYQDYVQRQRLQCSRPQ